MSVYLQRGDVVHLAMPMMERSVGQDVQEVARLQHEEMAAAYAKHGVTVHITITASSVPTPTVVAVFRQPEAS